MKDGILSRLYIKALKNEVAVAVGSLLSDSSVAIPTISKDIINTYKLDITVKNVYEYYARWNEIISSAERVASREKLIYMVRDKVLSVKPTEIHNIIASLPLSNFIDTTFDRSLFKAILAQGKRPILHDWEAQRMGSWKQSNPDNPNIFFMLPNVKSELPWHGIYEPTERDKQNRIQIENIMDMLFGKDLVLVGISSFEAEYVLHLNYILSSCNKIVSNCSETMDSIYSSMRGIYVGNYTDRELLEKLLPSSGPEYSFMDMLIPSRKLVDVGRKKMFDCFISYFSGDKEFVSWIDQQLRLREIHTWRDEREIDVGDSMTERIQNALDKSYTFVIVMTPEALDRPWVKKELMEAYSLELAGEMKILPVLHKECEIPIFLSDYKCADFRDERRYHEQLSILENSIKNSVKRFREKK